MWFIYVAPLFLYFPPLFPGVETQPLVAVCAAAYGLMKGGNRKAPVSFLVLALVLLLWIAFRFLIGDAPTPSVGLLQILVGPIMLFGAMAQGAPPPSRRVMAWITIYFVASAAFEIALPGAYGALAKSILSRANVTDGSRGVSLFTPEPTYAVITAIYFLLVARWSGEYWGWRYRWIEPMLALCLLATGSTYAGLLLLVLAYVRWPRVMLLSTLAGMAIIPVLGIVALDNEDSIRAVVAISRVMASDFTDFLPSISLIDSSLGSRLATNTASFLTPVHSPLGLGLDCSSVPSAFDAAGFSFVYDNPVLREVMDEGCLKPQSYAASIALGLGGLSLIFVGLMTGLARYARGAMRRSLWPAPAAVALVILIVQGQLTSPVPWLLAYMALCARHSPQRPVPVVGGLTYS